MNSKPSISDEREREEVLGQTLLAILSENRTHISTSFLQRRFRLGYTRAAAYMDDLEKLGVIAPRSLTSGTTPSAVLLMRKEAQ